MIRVTRIDFDDFKCVAHGGATLSSWEPGKPVSESDVIGIYGPNGSGKTAIVEAIGIFKKLASGGSLSKGDAECIAVGSHSATITLHGICSDENGLARCSFIYSVSLWSKTKDGFKASDDDLHIAEEKLAVKDYRANKPRLKTLFWRTAIPDGELSLAPESRWKPLLTLDDHVGDRFRLAQELALETRTSLLFSPAVRDVIKDMRRIADEQADALSGNAKATVAEVLEPLDLIVQELTSFASTRLVVVGGPDQAGGGSLKLRIPNRGGENGGGTAELGTSLDIDFSQPASMRCSECEALKDAVNALNPALSSLIPGFSLGVRELGTQPASDGGEAVEAEVMCSHDATAIPLRCESEGVKRLVSLLPQLVDVYANSDACVIVDDLDRGVFELLLGQILQVLRERGCGQLVFTAHDLRPLEVLSGRQLVLTTTNPHDRYTRFRGDRENTNLRNGYLRALTLGGQPAELCETTTVDEIAATFDGAAGVMKKLR